MSEAPHDPAGPAGPDAVTPPRAAGPVFDGVERARARTAKIDAEVIELLGPAVDAGGEHVALLAVGSYGRSELTPHSDVDVLVLHDLRGRDDIEALTRDLLYPLWDAGYELGHAVRSVSECIKWAKDEPIVATTLLDTRLVLGAGALAHELDGAIHKFLRKRRGTLDRLLYESLADRWARYGDAGRELQPHLKEGRGGLRDLQTLRWLEDGLELDTELAILLTLRAEMHAWAGKREDRLAIEAIGPIAERIGYDPDGEDPRNLLMRTVYDATRRVGALLGWRRTCGLDLPRRPVLPEGFGLSYGRLAASGAGAPAGRPEAAFDIADRADSIAPDDSLLTWAETGANVGIAWTPALRDRLVQFLATGPDAGWEWLDVSGLLVRYLPELAHARTQPQHNPLHHLAVDAHCWATLLEARHLLSPAADPVPRRAASELDDPTALILAAFLHDSGKGLPGDHSRQGVILARRVCERIGIGAGVGEQVAFLVGNHLLLSDVAQGRDLNDEELIVRLAAKIGDPQRLRMLYLLSIADARATGAAAWSPWKAQLLDELFTKLDSIVDQPDLVGREAGNQIERTRAEALRLRPGTQSQLEAFPRRYFLSQPSHRVATHLDLIDELGADRDTILLSADGGTVSFVAHDRPGLLSTIAGVLAVHGVDIRTAEVYTRNDNIAVDVLSVVGTHEPTVPPRRWDSVREFFAKLATGSGARQIDRGIAERADRYDKDPDPGVRVQVDNHASDWYSVVEVRGGDRTGLLYDVTGALAELGCDVHFAKVSTEATVARDTFSVRDAYGAKLTDPDGFAARLSTRIAERIDARSSDDDDE